MFPVPLVGPRDLADTAFKGERNEEDAMNLMDMLEQSMGRDGIATVGQQFGLDPETTRSLAGTLSAAIGAGAQERARSEGGLGGLLGMLEGETQGRYVDAPVEAAQPEAQASGEAFLRGIFGTDDAPRRLAQEAARDTKADEGTVASFLPALAAILQGVMQKQAPDAEIEGVRKSLSTGNLDRQGAGIGDLLGALQDGGGGGGGGLGGLIGMAASLLGGGRGGDLGQILQALDQDGDGSPLNDLARQLAR